MGHVRFWRSIFSWVPVTPPLLISFQVGQAESVLSSLQALKASKDTWQQHGSKTGGFETHGCFLTLKKAESQNRKTTWRHHDLYG